MLIDILSTLATALASILVVLAGYLTVLTVAAFLNRSRRAVEGPQTTRFAVLVPAHDEEVLISRTVSNLLAQDYPGGRFDVHVVADNCTDRTAELARAAGAQVHERHDLSARGKGRALRWLLANLKQAGQSYDAYIILEVITEPAPAH